MAEVYAAAGGGGDALAASIIHRTLDCPGRAVIATFAWDRLAVDPLPGPRSAADFDGLEPIGDGTWGIVATTKPRPPAGSTLPILAAEVPDQLVLLDPSSGAIGLRHQLKELVALYEPDTVTLVDVGGDSIAHGDEPGLRSPLADGLALAASLDLPAPTRLAVAGAGLDGELSEAEVLDVVGDHLLLRLDTDDVTSFKETLDWHPSEATALWVAAARGLRGTVEIRDSGLQVHLTGLSPNAYAIPIGDAVARNQLASALAQSSSLHEAEEICRDVCGFSEIDYERDKAARSNPSPPPLDVGQLDSSVRDFEHEALERGVDYVTFRRIAEAVASATEAPNLRRHLLATRPKHYVWPLWALRPVPARVPD